MIRINMILTYMIRGLTPTVGLTKYGPKGIFYIFYNKDTFVSYQPCGSVCMCVYITQKGGKMS